ncbi:MAG TPA: cytochrome P450 [Polyangiaceae bacterium]
MQGSPTFPGFPPGPPPARHLFEELGFLSDVRRDVLGTIAHRFATYGDLYYAEAIGHDVYATCHPDLIRDVLVTEARAFKKRTLDLEVLGNGLLLSDGEAWRIQRRRIQPGFRHESIQRYGQLIAEETERLVARLRPGQVIEARSEMMELTLRIVCRALFGQHFNGDPRRLTRALRVLQEQVVLPKLVPKWMPTPMNLRLRRMRALVDREVFGIIDRGAEPGSLLAELIATTDEQGGMTRQQLRDEVVTLFLAGHETTALALSWALYLLAQHPGVAHALADEARAAARGEPLCAKDFDALPLAARVLQETMRLYPPVYVIPRVCSEPTSLAGFPIRPNAEMWLWVYFMHHDARWFREPERFRPERFLPGGEAELCPHAFIPFGEGNRACVGRHFAMLEAVLVLAGVLRKFRVQLVDVRPVRPLPRITLGPARPIRLRLEANG